MVSHRSDLLLTACLLIHFTHAFIHTDQEVTGWKGGMVRLKCDFSGEPYALFWKQVTDSNPSGINKARLLNGDITNLEERILMEEDYSLTIEDLKVSDEGVYLCQLETMDGHDSEKSTHLIVNAMASKLTIDTCDYQSTLPNSEPGFCTYNTSHEISNLKLACKVMGFRPNISLDWTTYGSIESPKTNITQMELADGTFERIVTIDVVADSDVDQNFTCVAEGVTINGTASVTVTVIALPALATSERLLTEDKVLLAFYIFALVPFLFFIAKRLRNHERFSRKDMYGKVLCTIEGISWFSAVTCYSLYLISEILTLLGLSSWLYLSAAGFLVGIFCASSIVVYCLTRVLHRKCGKSSTRAEPTEHLKMTDIEHSSEEERLQHMQQTRKELQEEILSYQPGSVAKVQLTHGLLKVNVGFFGQMEAGKSAFIKTLNFALSGDYKTVAEEGSLGTNEGETIKPPHQLLTPFIDLIDSHGIRNLSDSYMEEILAQLRGERVLDPDRQINPNREDIHCAIFVYHCTKNGKEQALEFIKKFTMEVHKYYNRSPMLVVTHTNDIDDVEGLEDTLLPCDIPKENIWFFENYTTDSHTEDIEKDIELLQFLKVVLDSCDRNCYAVEMKGKGAAGHCQVIRADISEMNTVHSYARVQQSEKYAS